MANNKQRLNRSHCDTPIKVPRILSRGEEIKRPILQNITRHTRGRKQLS